MSAPRPIVIADPDADERARLVANVEAAARDRGLEIAVSEAADGHQALALIDRLRPALVVAEILLPGPSGLALIRRVREHLGEAAPLFLFVTAMSRESDRYWALRNGAHAYVIKPYEDEALQARLRQALGEEAEPDRLALI